MKTPPWKLTPEALAQQQAEAAAAADAPTEHANGIAKDAKTGRFIRGAGAVRKAPATKSPLPSKT